MKKVKTEIREPEMRAEYDFRGGVRGKYAARFDRGTNIVILEPDVAERFPDSKAVNEALRALAAVADRNAGRRSGRRSSTKSARGLTRAGVGRLPAVRLSTLRPLPRRLAVLVNPNG